MFELLAQPTAIQNILILGMAVVVIATMWLGIASTMPPKQPPPGNIRLERAGCTTLFGGRAARDGLRADDHYLKRTSSQSIFISN